MNSFHGQWSDGCQKSVLLESIPGRSAWGRANTPPLECVQPRNTVGGALSLPGENPVQKGMPFHTGLSHLWSSPLVAPGHQLRYAHMNRTGMNSFRLLQWYHLARTIVLSFSHKHNLWLLNLPAMAVFKAAGLEHGTDEKVTSAFHYFLFKVSSPCSRMHERAP